MRLTDHDASFLYAETASGPMHGATITVIDGEISFATFMDHMASRLHLIPRYRQRLAFVPFNIAHPKWIDDPDFDLKHHVRSHKVASGTSLEEAIQASIKLTEPLLPRDKPLWMMVLIEGVSGHTVLLSMGHHALVDGASGIDISLILFDLQKDPPPTPAPTKAWRPAPAPTPFELTSEAAAETAEKWRLQFGSQENSAGRAELLRRAAESMTRFISEPVVTAPWNASMIGPKRRFEWRRLPFGAFRNIRRSFGGTVNDVVLALVVESAARYMALHKERVAERHLRVMVPVSVRREDEKGALGNRVSGIFPMFGAEPMEITERLRKVRWETEHIKQNREAQAMELMMESMPSMPPLTMAPTLLVGSAFDPTAIAARFPLPVPPSFAPRLPMVGYNFTCTNIPGVQTAQYLLGHRISDSLAVLMLNGNIGYGIAVVSYNQGLYFNFISDPRLLPDLNVMADGVVDAFAELLAAADLSQDDSASTNAAAN